MIKVETNITAQTACIEWLITARNAAVWTDWRTYKVPVRAMSGDSNVRCATVHRMVAVEADGFVHTFLEHVGLLDTENVTIVWLSEVNLGYVGGKKS